LDFHNMLIVRRHLVMIIFLCFMYGLCFIQLLLFGVVQSNLHSILLIGL
jgi:hypothetical protein